MRDFFPEEVYKRNFIFDRMEEVFRRYGFDPIETPAMEKLRTLTGKYGEEGDKLLFKVLNNGDFLAKVSDDLWENRDSTAWIPELSKRGMRYDLTVPLARFVSMHQHEIDFPFKRYQIQPVWRADRPQKGRYREFYQCDADVIGTDSLLCEAECIQMYDEVFASLGIPVDIRLNNRKILQSLCEQFGLSDRFMAVTVSIDKWDKIGAEGVREELLKITSNEAAVDGMMNILEIDTLDELPEEFNETESGKRGIEELDIVNRWLEDFDNANEIRFDIRLARGLDYYTGCIFEVEGKKADLGSLGGGGRYDELTEVFGMKNVSGVGISFGAERIYDHMNKNDLFPGDLTKQSAVCFVTFDRETHRHAVRCANHLRREGLQAEVYPEPVKLKHQMKWADSKNFPWVVLIGGDELKAGVLTLRNMKTGDQSQNTLEELVVFLNSQH